MLNTKRCRSSSSLSTPSFFIVQKRHIKMQLSILWYSVPRKQFVWKSVLQSFYLELPLQVEHLWILLCSLNLPSSFPVYKVQYLFPVVSSSLWFIWCFHWQLVFQDIPYQPNIIISKIGSQVSIITNDHPLLD